MENKKRKVYAKTLNPEFFDYQAYEYDIKEDKNLIVDGGRDYCGFNNDVLSTIKNLHDDYQSWDYKSWLKLYYDNSIMKYFKNLLNLKSLTKRQAGRIRKALDSDDIDEIRIACLSVMRNIEFKKHVLRGYCQGEVVYLYAPVNTSQKFIDYIEAWYFATGVEIEIDDTGRNYVDNANDIEGFTFYTASWKDEDLKEEIINQVLRKDEKPEDIEVVLWKYTRTQIIKVDQYELAD